MVSFKVLESSQIEIIVNMMQDFYAIDNYPIDLEVSKKLFEDFISDEKLGKAWLLYSDNELVGYIILTYIFSFEYRGKIAFLDELYIIDSARNKGIGQATIEFVKDFAKSQNIKIMYLEVENNNQKAQKLYLANDFVIHNRTIMKIKF